MYEYHPEPLISNLYAKIERIREIGQIAPASDLDRNYQHWKNKFAVPKGTMSDTEIQDSIYTTSREIDGITNRFFYPRKLKVPYAFGELHENEVSLPEMVVSPDTKVYIINGVSSGTQPAQRQDLVSVDQRDYTIYSREADKNDPRIVIHDQFVRRYRENYNSWRYFNYQGTLRFYDWELEAGEFDWLPHYMMDRHDLIVKGTFGFLENGGVPLPIQKVCEYMTVKTIENIRSGDYEGSRGNIKSETTDGHSYTLDTAKDVVDKMSGVIITGVAWVDQILMRYVRLRPPTMLCSI